MAAADEEATGFAELLTGLKARTDRSYADLAQSLGMNVSTLYRYCAGEAVPREFAVVERFAVLCGASSRERVELHRRWILAAAERRRSRPGSTRPRRASQDVPEQGGEKQGGEEPGDVPEADGPPASLTRPVPGMAPARPAPPRSPSPSPSPEVAPGRTGVRSSRVRWRRRPALVSMAVGAVFALTTAGLSAFSVFPGFPDRGSPGGGTLPHLGTSASPTVARVRPSAPAAPFTWTVNSHVWEGDCGHDYVIAKPPGQVPPPPSAEDAEAWANAQDAVHGGETIVQVAVQGRTSSAVVLEALHVRVVHRAAPPGGGAFVYDTSPGCGGGITPRYFEVGLDAPDPVALAMPGSQGDVTVPARRFPYRVSVQDPEVLRVTARTGDCACEWYLDLDWSSEGRVGTTRIDDHGRPFRTTAVTGLPRYAYAGSPRHWTPAPPTGPS